MDFIWHSYRLYVYLSQEAFALRQLFVIHFVIPVSDYDLFTLNIQKLYGQTYLLITGSFLFSTPLPSSLIYKSPETTQGSGVHIPFWGDLLPEYWMKVRFTQFLTEISVDMLSFHTFQCHWKNEDAGRVRGSQVSGNPILKDPGLLYYVPSDVK